MYPFDIDSGKPGEEFFAECLGGHDSIKEGYLRSRSEAEKLGVSGESIRTIAVEYVFLKLRSELLTKIRQ